MVRVGVIGLGYWGPNLARNFNAADGVELSAICDLDERRLSQVAGSYPSAKKTRSVEEVLTDPDIDAVAIATPVNTHHPIAKHALNAGKHVLVEKPLSSTVEMAEELVDLAQSKGLVLMVDHIFAYSAPVRKMKEIYCSGQPGELFFIDSVRINLGLFQHDVNVVWDLAPHDLSIVDFLLGRLPKSLSAFGAIHAGNGIEDVAHLNLDFGNGLIANFHVNWLSPVKIRHTIIGGSRKSLVYNDLDPSEPLKVYDCGIEVKAVDAQERHGLLVGYRSGDVWSPHVDRTEPLRVMAEHFGDCVANGKRPITSGEEGLRVVRILDAAQRSIKAQGGRITL